MGIVELIIIILILLWLVGFFGGSRLGLGSVASGGAVHTLLVIVVILVILRLLGII